MRMTILLVAALLSAGCRPQVRQPGPGSAELQPQPRAVPAGWQLGNDVGTAVLAYASAIRLTCPAGKNQLEVNVPAFRAIGSEDRLSFGSGGIAVALAADVRGDARLGGVTGSGTVPDDLKGVVAGPIAASYGAQRSGPHPAPPAELARAFVTACFANASAAGVAASRPTATTNPCLVQDGELLRMKLRAVGTEPFWGARIEGRCVTYSTPEDQAGTRIWTRHNATPDGGVWTGALAGKRFVLMIDPTRSCSDGMSDKVYSMRVELTVNGEQRRGCAEAK